MSSRIFLSCKRNRKKKKTILHAGNFSYEWQLNLNTISEIIYYRENKIFLNIKLPNSECGEMQFTCREILKAEQSISPRSFFFFKTRHTLRRLMQFSCLGCVFRELRLALLFVLRILYCFVVVSSERHDRARLASQHELIRLTYLPDALGPPCTTDTHIPMCVCTRECMKCHLIGEIGACVNVVMLRFIPSDILESRIKEGCYVPYRKKQRGDDGQQGRYSMTSKYF